MNETHLPLRRVFVPRRDSLYVRLSMWRNILIGVLAPVLFLVLAAVLYYTYVTLGTEDKIDHIKDQKVETSEVAPPFETTRPGPR